MGGQPKLKTKFWRRTCPPSCRFQNRHCRLEEQGRTGFVNNNVRNRSGGGRFRFLFAPTLCRKNKKDAADFPFAGIMKSSVRFFDIFAAN